MSVLILSGATADYDCGSIAAANHARFARLTGHRQQFRTDGFLEDRPPSWSKIAFVREAFTQHSPRWVFWIDADAVFLRTADLATLVSPHCLIFGVDVNGINAGVFFARNTPWTVNFLSRVHEMGYLERWRTHPHWEQAAITHLYLTDGDVREHVSLVSQRKFNSYPHVAESYLDGDLVAHFCGGSEGRLERVTEWARRLDCE